MKILLSASKYHFDPDTNPNVVRVKHSVGILTKLFYDVLKELGEVTYISDVDQINDQEFDLICSWPRNYWYTTTHNKCHKKICFLNIAEPNFLRNALSQEAGRLGCRLTDCFVPTRFNTADLYFLIGGPVVKQQYLDAGYPDRIVEVKYRHNTIPFKARDKNKRPVFLHLGTTLGLRKGFWHVVNDFKKADLDAELWCVGNVQAKESFWLDYAKEAEKDPRIKVFGWVDCDSPQYKEIIHGADFMVFPSFGEGQPGTVVEATEGGCLPITSHEAGFGWNPLGEYVRGDPAIYVKAYNLPNELFRSLQLRGQNIMDYSYNNNTFKNIVSRNIGRLLNG